MDIISYKSIFSPKVDVIILFEQNPRYKDFEPLFEEYGYGFVSPNDNLVILDGEVFSDATCPAHAHNATHARMHPHTHQTSIPKIHVRRCCL